MAFSPNVKARYSTENEHHQDNLITSNWPQSPYYLIQFRYRRQFHWIYWPHANLNLAWGGPCLILQRALAGWRWAPPEDRVGVGLPSFTRSIGGGGVSISATNYDTWGVGGCLSPRLGPRSTEKPQQKPQSLEKKGILATFGEKASFFFFLERKKILRCSTQQHNTERKVLYGTIGQQWYQCLKKAENEFVDRRVGGRVRRRNQFLDE